MQKFKIWRDFEIVFFQEKKNEKKMGWIEAGAHRALPSSLTRGSAPNDTH